jgi:membrane protease YdiL (CAAX protease family)
MFPESAAPEPLPALPSTPPAAEIRPRAIAPLWHTLLLVAAIAAYSFWGAQHWHPAALDPLAPVPHGAAGKQHINNGADPLRLLRYALSAGLELLIVAWVALGLRLRRVPFRSLFGNIPCGLNAITLEAGIAALFWLSSMTVLVVLALVWQGVATQVYHHQAQKQQTHSASPSSPKPESPEKKQLETVRELLDLAPANGLEIAAWGALCLIVGFSEELVFRGYLQSQGIALLHRIPLGVLLSAIVFGFAHGYQGLRGMCLIGAFGAMFSIITLMRRNLFPAMLAHAWHDFLMGLLLALVRATHMIDKLLASS